MQTQLSMRELTLDEIDAVSGAGWFSNFFSAFGDFVGFDGHFGYQGGGGGSLSLGGFFGAVGNLFGGNVSYFSTETITTNDLPNGDTEVVITLHRGSGDTIWTLPNTALGLAVGQAGYAFDHIPGFGDGSAGVTVIDGNLVFTDDPFSVSALTLGHVIIVGERSTNTDGSPALGTIAHEQPHVIQGDLLGPLYVPSNLLGGTAALLLDGNWHGPTNWNEVGPQLDSPQPWPQ